VIRVWGDPSFQTLGQRWAERFRASHPRDRIAFHMTGSDTGMAGLYTGEADLALLDRPATPSELQAFEWVFRHPPTCTEITLNGTEAPGRLADGALLYAYQNSGQGTQPLTPLFLQYSLSHSGQTARACASTR
jgi:DNA-binding transcriptional LysR family regulator